MTKSTEEIGYLKNMEEKRKKSRVGNTLYPDSSDILFMKNAKKFTSYGSKVLYWGIFITVFWLFIFSMHVITK